jgi:hypothetical protein
MLKSDISNLNGEIPRKEKETIEFIEKKRAKKRWKEWKERKKLEDQK